MTRTAHLALLDTLADWEVGHLLVELRTGRFTGEPFDVVMVGAGTDPVTTMGGMRVIPDLNLDAYDPSRSDVLILPGSDAWDTGPGAAFVEAAGRTIDAGVPVAAICGAVFALAAAGLLDDRTHTGADPGYIASSGYAGAEHYVEARAVVDGDVITAGPSSPVQFARVTLEHLGLMSDEVGEAYEGVFHREDPSAYQALMAASS